MKILHITNNYPTKDLPIFGVFVKEQIESLDKIGIASEVFFINGKGKGKIEYLIAVFRLIKHLKKNQYDLIHCHHVFSALVFIVSGYHKKVKSIVSFQNDPINESKFNLIYFVKRRIDSWIFKNDSTFVDGKKGFYFPNGVNTSFFKPIPKIEAKQFLGLDTTKHYILFVSSSYIRQQKRYDIFNQTLDIIKRTNPLVEELIMINVRRELVPYYFNSSSIHLLTSDFEGSPNSVKEAMACNTPVVSTSVGNVNDLFQNVDGCYICSNQPEELAVICLKILDKGFTNARDQIKAKKLDINSVAIELKKIYNKTINN